MIRTKGLTSSSALRLLILLTLVCVFFSVLASLANALPWAPMTSAVPGPSRIVPSAKAVPGKDFSDIRDRDAAGIFDPEQVVAWDGLGGVRDSFDYSGTRVAFPEVNQQQAVDGLAAGGDALFQALRDDQAALLFSVEGDPDIYFERATGFVGAPAGFGLWASELDIDAMNPPDDTDALEVWGGDNSDDSDRYSLAGDPPIITPGGMSKVAIWGFTPAAGPSIPHTFTSDLAAAMDLQFGGPGVGGPFWSQLVELMDVDAIMTFGPQVTFSIRPIDLTPAAPLILDGGEIFEYDGPGIPTRFLRHGGHLWDTAFDVRGTFSLISENIDAIEAVAQFVPEPSSLLLVLLGVSLLTNHRPR